MSTNKSKKQDSYSFGLIGEYIAMLWYLITIHLILRHRFKTKYGEIDFVCKRFNTLIFVEVKSRSSDYDQILCTKSQQVRIMRAAEFFLLKNPGYRNYQLRFDLVLIRPFCRPIMLKNFIEC